MTISPIRADRLATLYFFQHLNRFAIGRRGHRIPILMYHSICRPTGQPFSPYFVTETAPEVFDQHLKHLHDNGYTAISLDELVSALHSREVPHQKRVVITFDDGYRDFYTDAFPILQKYGFGASVFLAPAYIHHQSRVFKGKECMTWAEVREMHKAGTIFGSHTVNHPHLERIPFAEAKREIRNSKDIIENALGTSVRSFSYPFGFPKMDKTFTSRLRNTLQECGYHNGVTTVLGSAHSPEDRFFLKRLPVNTWDDPAFLQAKIDGSYDWLHWLQHINKSISHTAGIMHRKFRSQV